MLKLSIKGPHTAKAAWRPSPGPQAEVWRDSSGQIAAYAEIIDEEYWMHLPGLASFRFSSQGSQVDAKAIEDVPEGSVLDAYHRKVLPFALQIRGWEVLHASAVSSEIGVVALCGNSETGKSTIAFALSRRDYTLWADDALTFEVNGSGPLALSLPFSSRLRPAATDFFNHASGDFVGTIDSSAIKKAPLLAACVLHRQTENSDIVIERLSSSRAFAALLDHACCFVPQTSDRKRLMIDHYLNTVAQIPIFDVSFPSGLDNLSNVVDAIQDLIPERATETRTQLLRNL